MTMFSPKPPFDLAAFLAVPAKVGSARSRGGRRAPTPPAPLPETTATDDDAPADTPET